MKLASRLATECGSNVADMHSFLEIVENKLLKHQKIRSEEQMGVLNELDF